MTPAIKQRQRDALAADVEAFLARGGRIESIPQGVSGETRQVTVSGRGRSIRLGRPCARDKGPARPRAASRPAARCRAPRSGRTGQPTRKELRAILAATVARHGLATDGDLKRPPRGRAARREAIDAMRDAGASWLAAAHALGISESGVRAIAKRDPATDRPPSGASTP